MAFRFSYNRDYYPKRKHLWWKPQWGESYAATTILYINIIDERKSIFQPYLALSRVWASIAVDQKEIMDTYIWTEYYENTVTVANFGASLSYALSKTTRLALDAAIAINSENDLKTVALSVSLTHAIGRQLIP